MRFILRPLVALQRSSCSRLFISLRRFSEQTSERSNNDNAKKTESDNRVTKSWQEIFTKTTGGISRLRQSQWTDFSQIVEIYNRVTEFDVVRRMDEESKKYREDLHEASRSLALTREERKLCGERLSEIELQISALRGLEKRGVFLTENLNKHAELRTEQQQLIKQDGGKIVILDQEIMKLEERCRALQIKHADAIHEYFKEYSQWSDRLRWWARIGYGILLLVNVSVALAQYYHRRQIEDKTEKTLIFVEKSEVEMKKMNDVWEKIEKRGEEGREEWRAVKELIERRDREELQRREEAKISFKVRKWMNWMKYWGLKGWEQVKSWGVVIGKTRIVTNLKDFALVERIMAAFRYRLHHHHSANSHHLAVVEE